MSYETLSFDPASNTYKIKQEEGARAKFLRYGLGPIECSEDCLLPSRSVEQPQENLMFINQPKCDCNRYNNPEYYNKNNNFQHYPEQSNIKQNRFQNDKEIIQDQTQYYNVPKFIRMEITRDTIFYIIIGFLILIIVFLLLSRLW